MVGKSRTRSNTCGTFRSLGLRFLSVLYAPHHKDTIHPNKYENGWDLLPYNVGTQCLALL